MSLQYVKLNSFNLPVISLKVYRKDFLGLKDEQPFNCGAFQRIAWIG